MPLREHAHLAVALDGSDPQEFLRLAQRAEEGLLDFVTAQDGPGQLDPTLLTGLAAAGTDRIGLVPLETTAGDPSVFARRITTLDRLSAGRAGVRPRVATSAADHDRLVGLLGTPEGDLLLDGLFEQAGEFLARADRSWGAVRPPVVALAHATAVYRFSAAHADVVLVTPTDTGQLVAIRKEVDTLAEEAGRPPGSLRVLADLNVLLGEGETFDSDAAVFIGTPDALADRLQEWFEEGGADGFRLRPADAARDVETLVAEVVPELQLRGLFRTSYPDGSLRSRLGLA
ncbi:LLM class flavin-dependent oxidoreductase [Streptomyces beijiangensis]|uniref:LLM class flavin-dependent oxidoreductase n=1 Tax=Streptomyces beijiangensis TaxID=163361 RepID=A0A939F4U4_9ACTN|nr:LLM class flavin-dependent oxidoreductase [Streptomyces beijiangensis]MBO0512320.1 LLM class flavin-dependent oxidoreductase [Streptomyces beijiangensis]